MTADVTQVEPETLREADEHGPEAKPGGATETRPLAPAKPPPPEIYIASPGVNPKPGWRVGLVWPGDRPGRLVAHNRPMKVVKVDLRSGKIVLKPIGAAKMASMQAKK
jgi:hypothetical protein